ncbi:hypothetical protein [Pseudoalteromonas sp. JSTW]|nr:hypothetical protein [Pseudoalteromonas sp. JSTW]
MKLIKLLSIALFFGLFSLQSVAGDDDWKSIAEKRSALKVKPTLLIL